MFKIFKIEKEIISVSNEFEKFSFELRDVEKIYESVNK